MASLKGKNRNLGSEMNHRIQILEMELRFLKMFIWFLPRRSRKNHYIRATVGNGKLGLYGDRPDRALELAISKLLQKIELCKPKIRDDCLNLIDLSSFHRKFSSSDELLKFINFAITNLKNLVSLKAGAGAIVSRGGMRKQIGDLIKNLRMFRDFVKSTGERWCFTVDVQEYVYKTTYLSMLYWVEQIDELMPARMKTIITDLRQMVRSYCPEITGLYIRVLRVSKFLQSDNSEISETIVSFVDFILPLGFMKILRHELIFLVSFIIDPLVKEMDSRNWDPVVAKAKAVAAEIPSLISSLTAGDMNQEEIITKERADLLGDFKRKIHEIMEEVRKLHFHLPKSSGSCFPATNPLGFFDSLLENLGNLKDTLMDKVKFLPFARDLILTLHRELVCLRPSLTQTHGVQDEFEELKDLWLKITNAAYRADYVIDSCQILHLPIWHNLISLSDVIEEIKFTRQQIEKIVINQIYTSSRIMNSTVDLISSSSSSSSYPLRSDEIVVGFKDEEEEITRRLTRGKMELEVVSIVGMPGQGKTTLAKKIYNSPTVRKHFTKFAWCFVTQIYNVSNLLSDIFRDIDNGSHHLMKYGLPEKVRKCLSGERYLIIMDDIWDITVWNAIKESFPDDNNGSRILFTSRNSNLCCNRNSHLLRPFSEEESTELLEQKLSNYYNYWRYFDDSSYSFKRILNVCNGLPLAIVAVAGLLTRVSSYRELFQLVQNLTSNLANEGCMDILELSYKSLPSYLKPCFLYLGALGQQTNVFKVQKLIHLWIAEGFVQKSGTKSLEELSMEYLEDLVSRNLIIVNKKSSSNGEIKQCRIHDLIHELCLRKAEEERFIHFPNSSPPINHDQYRICIYNSSILGSISDKEPPPAGTNIRSLLLPLNNYRSVYPYSSKSTFFMCLKFVRVLDLVSLDSHHCFPEEILILICLRYISIKCQVEAIPPSIGNLHNLEFLHLVRRTAREGSRIQFPHTIWKLKQLKNVDVGPGANIMLLDDDDDYDAELCNLDSFSSLRLCNVEDAERILRRFPSIRKLRLELSESWSCRRNCYQFQALNLLSKLESLSMEYPREVIHSCAFNFPTAIGSLTLSRFFHPWTEISNIGKLPNLKVLKLLNSAFVGKRWDVEDDAFLKLKYLKLSDLGLSYWEASTSSFPCLERLVLRSCYFLEELPSSFGEILTLKTIDVRYCQYLRISAESILNEQIELGNEDLKLLMSDAPGSINYN